ncbi:MAG: cytochrome o ubiquinol oxidase subunit IV [Sneathiella sp.]
MKADNSHSLKSYLIGFGLAVTLTIIPFGLVWTGTMPSLTTLVIIVVAALAQVLVHLYFFLHLNFRSTPGENILALAFATILIMIMVGGSIWIMFDLHHRMM